MIHSFSENTRHVVAFILIAAVAFVLFFQWSHSVNKRLTLLSTGSQRNEKDPRSIAEENQPPEEVKQTLSPLAGITETIRGLGSMNPPKLSLFTNTAQKPWGDVRTKIKKTGATLYQGAKEIGSYLYNRLSREVK